MDEYENLLSLITDEILLLEKYKYNLKKTGLNIVIKRTKGFSKQYYLITDEIERVAIEVRNLEEQKTEILNFIEENTEITTPEIIKQREVYTFQKPINL